MRNTQNTGECFRTWGMPNTSPQRGETGSLFRGVEAKRVRIRRSSGNGDDPPYDPGDEREDGRVDEGHHDRVLDPIHHEREARRCACAAVAAAVASAAVGAPRRRRRGRGAKRSPWKRHPLP